LKRKVFLKNQKHQPNIVRDEGEAQAGVTVEVGLLERIDGNDIIVADPHLGGTSIANHTGLCFEQKHPENQA
jgi:hypothetical protein